MKLIKHFLKKTIVVSAIFGLLLSSCMTAFADVSLPEGVVAGLPEGLTAMDGDGNVVNAESGVYFFEVEGMDPFVEYTKEIQLMNLRDDKAYHIYFYVEPLDKEGEIDLENECQSTFKMGNDTFFVGKVNGEPEAGYINLAEEVYDLGLYKPGDTRTFTCTTVWDPTYEIDIDYGEREYDVDGEHIIRPAEEDVYIYGQVRYKWIFYAAVDEDYKPPKTGVQASGFRVYICIFAGLAAMIGILLILVAKKKKGEESEA